MEMVGGHDAHRVRTLLFEHDFEHLIDGIHLVVLPLNHFGSIGVQIHQDKPIYIRMPNQPTNKMLTQPKPHNCHLYRSHNVSFMD